MVILVDLPAILVFIIHHLFKHTNMKIRSRMTIHYQIKQIKIHCRHIHQNPKNIPLPPVMECSTGKQKNQTETSQVRNGTKSIIYLPNGQSSKQARQEVRSPKFGRQSPRTEHEVPLLRFPLPTADRHQRGSSYLSKYSDHIRECLLNHQKNVGGVMMPVAQPENTQYEKVNSCL